MAKAFLRDGFVEIERDTDNVVLRLDLNRAEALAGDIIEAVREGSKVRRVDNA